MHKEYTRSFSHCFLNEQTKIIIAMEDDLLRAFRPQEKNFLVLFRLAKIIKTASTTKIFIWQKMRHRQQKNQRQYTCCRHRKLTGPRYKTSTYFFENANREKKVLKETQLIDLKNIFLSLSIFFFFKHFYNPVEIIFIYSYQRS